MIHTDVEICTINCLDDLVAIRDDWNALQDACQPKHVLLDHRWVTAWWRHFGRGKTLHTLVLRRSGTIHGIVPLVLSRGWEVFPSRNPYVQIADDTRYFPSMRWRRLVPIRRLTFPLNIPSANTRSHFLLRGGDTRLIEAVLSYCLGISGQWDILSLEGFPEESEQVRVLRERAPSFGLRSGRSRFTRGFLRTTLPDSMDAFLAARSRHFRKRFRTACRQSAERTADLGGIRIREFRGNAVGGGMDTLFDLERQSWKVTKSKKRMLHLSLNEDDRRFHREVAESFAATDQAQVLVTEVGGRPANALYSLEREGVVSCVLTYRAEALADRVTLAPLWGRFFELAMERGLREIDFNGKNRSLMKYADGENGFSRIVLYNSHFYSSLLRAAAGGANRLAHAFAAGHSAGQPSAKRV